MKKNEQEYVITATLINRETGKRIPVHSTCDPRYHCYDGKAKWQGEDGMVYCPIGLEFIHPSYRVEDVSDMDELMRYRMLYSDYLPDWLLHSTKDEALVWECNRY